MVEELRGVNPHWDGDRLYHEGRKVVGAELQHITWHHWLPAVLGPAAMATLGQYPGYSPSTNPTIANVFATAALRFGHTMISPVMRRLTANLTSILEGDLSLHEVTAGWSPLTRPSSPRGAWWRRAAWTPCSAACSPPRPSWPPPGRQVASPPQPPGDELRADGEAV